MDQELYVLGFAGLAQPGYCFLNNIEGFEGDLESETPVARGEEIPTAKMKHDLPKKLPDHVGNHDGALIASPRLVSFLREHVADIEFLPLKILNGKKLVTDEYQVAHLLNPVDCIDMKAADPDWSWDNKKIERMNDRKLPLLMEQIPQDRQLFCPKSFPGLRLVRREFGELAIAAGFTNIKLDTIEHTLAYL